MKLIDTPHAVLKRIWGFDGFRSIQESIIQSVLQGTDTLALMPTGGGKSICFQVPALCMEGLCIVVSPLIALMRDQVQNLKSKGIDAMYLHAGMSAKELDVQLDNCVYGDYKFLYVSPERLQSELFLARLPKMNVCLLAIDESHCISQWGYDFRPPYLQIADLHAMLPNKPPILAVTATATPRVAQDIMEKLRFRGRTFFQMSFKRDNLGYVVVKTANKYGKLLEVLERIQGSAVVYLRSRRGTAQLAAFLQGHGIAADYYHAGLEADVRNQKQEAWTSGAVRAIVATNAFGMGIDKPDVRLVVHMDLPDSLEAYFQEAGRGGRDGQTAWAVLLTSDQEAHEIEARNLAEFPDLATIKNTYKALGSHYHMLPGTGEGQSFPLDYKQFCDKYQFKLATTRNALKILERQGYIVLNEDFWETSKLHITASQTDLYGLQVHNKNWEVFLSTLLRMYGGLREGFVSINEQDIAKKLRQPYGQVVKQLNRLEEMQMGHYTPKKSGNVVMFATAFHPPQSVLIADTFLKDRLSDLKARLHSLKNYVTDESTCRSVLLVQYFGEENPQDCGKCDVCRRKKKITPKDNQAVIQDLLKKHGPLSLQGLLYHWQPPDQKEAVATIRKMLDEGRIQGDAQQLISIKK